MMNPEIDSLANSDTDGDPVLGLEAKYFNDND